MGTPHSRGQIEAESHRTHNRDQIEVIAYAVATIAETVPKSH